MVGVRVRARVRVWGAPWRVAAPLSPPPGPWDCLVSVEGRVRVKGKG